MSEIIVGYDGTEGAKAALDKAVSEGVDDSYQLQQTIRRVVGRWVSGTHRRRPMIIPVVLEA